MAVHFELFDILVHIGGEASSKRVANTANEKRDEGDQISRLTYSNHVLRDRKLRESRSATCR